MKRTVQKMVFATFLVVTAVMLTGCTNWKKKYNALDVEHQNLKGLYENCVASLESSASEKSQMSQELAKSQQELAELKRQMQQGKTAAQATGFSGDVKVDEAAGTITVTLPNEILFASGKATLKGATSSELDQIYSVLRERYSGKKVDVVGHTDTDPIRKTKDQWKDNWELSAERALTVLRYLVDRGVSPQNIRAVACGESRPVASNSTASGKAKNRRVEIVVHVR
ncbi:MAG TPA: OmpA family protein [Anaerohalosphaeraceae bacterium]|nr:OmpA family protein [Anaerohalosphaeraceae bacterium]HOL31595.1 OmpA family protein [Anaerohalosphaeraceae bacterium]HOM75956.1 OmpA family protein [Anaerohalosphaeraceae bacterium]HPC63506.1 OmpA family protein [Anaerohalosphaeraceae bacterium]HPO69952.1 OmpA family protein [Anaerohalosphaeraceae bacterium]